VKEKRKGNRNRNKNKNQYRIKEMKNRINRKIIEKKKREEK
jgi:hypothetical protein